MTKGPIEVNIIEELFNNSIDKFFYARVIFNIEPEVFKKSRAAFKAKVIGLEKEVLYNVALSVFGLKSRTNPGLKYQELLYVGCHYLRYSRKYKFQEIGRVYLRDHSTIMYGIKQVENFISIDEDYSRKYQEFKVKADEEIMKFYQNSAFSKLKFNLIDDGESS